MPLSYLLLGFDLIKRTVEDASPYGWKGNAYAKNIRLELADKQNIPSDAVKLAFLREEGGPRKWWKERAQLKILHKLKIENSKYLQIKVHTYLKLAQKVK